LSDDVIFVAGEGTEFQQLFAGAYCLSHHGENDLFHLLKLRMFPKSMLPAYSCQEERAHLASFWWISTRLHGVTFRVTVNDMRTSMSCYLILYMLPKIG